jgi:hypothetical protein
MQEAFQEGVSGRRFGKAFREGVSGRCFRKAFREGVSGRRFGEGFVPVADPFAHTSTVTSWVLQLDLQ